MAPAATPESSISSSSTLEWLLRRLPYFARLPDSQIGGLAERAVRHSFDPGQMICVEGEPSAGLWAIEQGRVKVFRVSTDGREHVLRLFGPGDSFNDVAGLDGRPNPAHAAALGHVVAWSLPHEVVAAALRDNPALALAVIDELTDRLRSLVSQIEELALHSVTVRLARFLLLQAENPSLSGEGITRATIAAHLATTPETVSRALRTLEDEGLIRFDRHRIVVAAPDELRRVAMQ